jgi:hypothetical protein
MQKSFGVVVPAKPGDPDVAAHRAAVRARLERERRERAERRAKELAEAKAEGLRVGIGGLLEKALRAARQG